MGERGSYQLPQEVPTLELPATVQAVLAARIDRLPLIEKRLLQTAAVIGTEAPFALLHAMAAQPEEALRRGLRHLQSAEFLYERGFFPELEYTFKHPLTYEVAFGSLLPEQRRALHARIVEAIDLRFDLRHSFVMLAEYRRILGHLQDAEALARTMEDHHRHAWVDAYLAHCFYVAGDLDGAIEAGQRALACSAAQGDFALQVAANFYLAQASHARGEYRRATACAASVIESLEGELLQKRFGTAGLPSAMARCWLAWCLADLGEFREGRGIGEAGVRVAEAGDHPLSLMGGCYGLGLVYLYQGDFTRAIPFLERGLHVSQRGDLPWLIPWPSAALGYAYALWLLGEITSRRGPLGVQPAHDSYQQARALATELGMRPLLAHSRLGLGSLYAETKQWEMARGGLSAAMELFRMLEMACWLSRAEAVLGRVKAAEPGQPIPPASAQTHAAHG